MYWMFQLLVYQEMQPSFTVHPHLHDTKAARWLFRDLFWLNLSHLRVLEMQGF